MDQPLRAEKLRHHVRIAHQPGDAAVAGGMDQQRMERHVRRQKIAQPLPFECRAPGLHHLGLELFQPVAEFLESLNVPGSNPFDGQRDRVRLQALAQLVKLHDFAAADATHDGAVAGHLFHQPDAGQFPQRLAHWRAADAEILGKRGLGKNETGPQVAAQDPLTDVIHCFLNVTAARRGHGRWLRVDRFQAFFWNPKRILKAREGVKRSFIETCGLNRAVRRWGRILTSIRRRRRRRTFQGSWRGLRRPSRRAWRA